MSTEDNEYIANRKSGLIYFGNFTGGKYISVTARSFNPALSKDDIAVIQVSPRVELRVSYIESKDNINSVRLKKIKFNAGRKVWEDDGEVSLSNMEVKDLAGLSEVFSKISLGDISRSKIDIEQFKVGDETQLEQHLRTLLSTPVGRKIISIISQTQSISDADIINVAFRREQLEIFGQLLDDENYFQSKKAEWNCRREEDVWQRFFELNPWIFGYGLSLISCENFNDQRLEQIVSSATAFQPGGKEIDALLKTRGFIKSLIFCEIKTHKTDLLSSSTYRSPDTFQVSREVSGACSQIQKTIHKTTLRLTENSYRLIEKDGTPTGEEVALAQPRGVLLIGSLKEFEEDSGINFEKFTSFELYRRNIQSPEIITFDELYERAKFIVESSP